MQVTATTLSLTVDDVAASRDFLTTHFGYRVRHADDGFAALGRDDAAADIVLLRRGAEGGLADGEEQTTFGTVVPRSGTGELTGLSGHATEARQGVRTLVYAVGETA